MASMKLSETLPSISIVAKGFNETLSFPICKRDAASVLPNVGARVSDQTATVSHDFVSLERQSKFVGRKF